MINRLGAYPRKLGRFLHWYAQADAALQYGARRQIPGMAFARFGRQIGRRLLPHAPRSALEYRLTPVHITRYFEFQFALECLPPNAGACLDVSSPRLFGLYVAAGRRHASLRIINPDRADLDETRRLVQWLRLPSITLACEAVDAVAQYESQFDTIWSISVVEHIAGAYDDTHAVQLLFAALRPGGRLILTVPVDQRDWEEFRAPDAALRGEGAPGEAQFFQRFYTAEAIERRLLAPLGRRPARVAWFGEREAGRFQEYVARWRAEGPAVTVEDPREIADRYRYFDSWAEMPGVGVCALLLEK